MDKSYLRIRNFLGILGCLLPILSVAFASLSPNIHNEGWWYSISVTYYSSPILTMLLTSVALFLICYRGYNIWDTLVNTIAGVFALGVVLFPCTCPWLDNSSKVGLFWIPMNITSPIHGISAGILFVLLAVDNFWLFSKGENKKKKIVYRVCGSIILLALVLFLFTCVIFTNCPKWLVIVWESVMLFAFGFSWITKGHMLDKIFGD